MNHFATLAEAREYAKDKPVTVCILEIEHAASGRRFIASKGTLEQFRKSLKANPGALPEIKTLVAEHNKRTEEEQRAWDAKIEQEVRDDCRCERCGVKVDMDTDYHQQEWARFGSKPVRVVAYYCKSCHRLLSTIGQGEHTELQERAGEVPSYEPYTKTDY